MGFKDLLESQKFKDFQNPVESQRSRNITVSRSWSSKNVTVSRSLRCVRETSRSPKPWTYESPSELEFRGSIDVENSNGKSGVSIMLL